MLKGTTFRRTRYRLGTILRGLTYMFTGIAEFRTEIAARDYIREHRQAFEAGPVYVFRERECWLRGVNYGTDLSDPLPEAPKEKAPEAFAAGASSRS